MKLENNFCSGVFEREWGVCVCSFRLVKYFLFLFFSLFLQSNFTTTKMLRLEKFTHKFATTWTLDIACHFCSFKQCLFDQFFLLSYQFYDWSIVTVRRLLFINCKIPKKLCKIFTVTLWHRFLWTWKLALFCHWTWTWEDSDGYWRSKSCLS